MFTIFHTLVAVSPRQLSSLLSKGERSVRSSVSCVWGEVIISRLQMGHNLLRVVNQGVLPKSELQPRSEGRATCMIRGIRDYMEG